MKTLHTLRTNTEERVQKHVLRNICIKMKQFPFHTRDNWVFTSHLWKDYPVFTALLEMPPHLPVPSF